VLDIDMIQCPDDASVTASESLTATWRSNLENRILRVIIVNKDQKAFSPNLLQFVRQDFFLF
jgi:hypothetical protein